MRQYFAYIRVSTAKQGEHGSSLQEQRSAIEVYASRNNLSIVAWFEERETAAKQGRAVFSKMLAKLEKGEAQGVVIHKIDRSARNLKDWANLGDLIDRGIDVQFVHDSFDMHSRGGRLTDAYLDRDIDKEVFEHRKTVVLEERANLRDELARLSANDLPVRRALRNLELGNAALSGYKSGIPAEQREIIESATSNFTLHGKSIAIALRSPFRGLANWRKSQIGAPHRDTPQERAKQILAILMAPDTASGKEAIRGKAANDDGLQRAA